MESWIDTHGHEVAAHAAGALRLVVVCVSSFFPTSIGERIRLMRAVGAQLGDGGGQHATLWLYPSGMFGFDSSRYDTKRYSDGIEVLSAERYPEVVAAHPPNSVIIFGSDDTAARQMAVVCRDGRAAHTITRGQTPEHERVIEIGSHRVFVLVCGEIIGSKDQGQC